MNDSIHLGFSTGTTYKHFTVLQALDGLLEKGIDVAELCYVRYDRLRREDLPSDVLKTFRYLSLHAPNDITYGDSDESRQVIAGIQKINISRPLDLVLFHPYAGMNKDFFTQLPFPVAFENMDATKDYGKTVADMKEVFDGTDFNMVLDLNHVYTNDPTMQLAQGLYAEFKDRISQIHLSGFTELHEPLYKTGQDDIIKAIPDRSLPIIIESILQPDEIGEERDYVLSQV